MHLTHLQLATIKGALKQHSTITSPTLDESLNFSSKTSASSAQNYVFENSIAVIFFPAQWLISRIHRNNKTRPQRRTTPPVTIMAQGLSLPATTNHALSSCSAKCLQECYQIHSWHQRTKQKVSGRRRDCVAWYRRFQPSTFIKRQLSTSHKSTNMSQCWVG
jgi:hypothetical protein